MAEAGDSLPSRPPPLSSAKPADHRHHPPQVGLSCRPVGEVDQVQDRAHFRRAASGDTEVLGPVASLGVAPLSQVQDDAIGRPLGLVSQAAVTCRELRATDQSGDLDGEPIGVEGFVGKAVFHFESPRRRHA